MIQKSGLRNGSYTATTSTIKTQQKIAEPSTYWRWSEEREEMGRKDFKLLLEMASPPTWKEDSCS